MVFLPYDQAHPSFSGTASLKFYHNTSKKTIPNRKAGTADVCDTQASYRSAAAIFPEGIVIRTHFAYNRIEPKRKELRML